MHINTKIKYKAKYFSELDLPVISVLLPVYNTNPEYLRESINSILNQTFKNFELIILNDASTKNLDDVINSFNDVRIRYYKNEINLGITKTRNKLLELAKGKYIAIADHDDISLPYRFEKEYNFLEQNPDISIVSGWINIFGDKTLKNKVLKTKPRPDFLNFLKRCELFHPACMWRKADFVKFDIKYEDGYVGVQDYAMFSKAIKYMKFANLQEILLMYRKHESNTSNQKLKMCIETEKVKNQMLNFLTSNETEKRLLYNKFVLSEDNFIHKIFSCKNISNYKIIRFFGFMIKIKRFETE